MIRNLKEIVSENKAIIIASILGITYWFIEVCVHYCLLYDIPIAEAIFPTEIHEIWMRSAGLFLFIGFGIYVQFLIHKKERAEKKAEDAFKVLNQIFNTAADGMRIVDKDFNVLRTNNTLVTLSGTRKKEALKSKCYKSFPGADCGTERCPLKKILSGDKYIEYETIKKHKTGIEIPCIITATPFFDKAGVLVGMVEDFRDITHCKIVENDLRKAKKGLEEKVEKRTEKLRKMQQEMIETEKLAALGKMSSAVAHELRNPMGVIKLAAYSLKKKIGKDQNTYRHLVNIDKKIDVANQIIHNLLAFSRASKLELKEYKLNKIINNALENINKIAEEEQVKIIKKIDLKIPKIKVDGVQLIEVFSNIFLNAVQSMGKTKKKELFISAKRIDNFIEIEIKDTGVGIAKENLEKLGTPFFSTKTKGIGLGLYITYEVIHLHKGKIEVRSEVGKGSAFVIKLPLE